MPTKKKNDTEEAEVVEEETSTTLAIAVQDMPITWTMVKGFASTASIPTRYHGKPYDILTTMKMGQELGVPPLEALNEIYIVNGKPSASGKLLAAMIWRAGHIIIVDPSAEGAVVRSWRKINDKYHEMPEVSFLKVDAERANLMDKETYQQYPQAMMAWRAITLAARLHFPDVVSSIGYVPEEHGLDDTVMMEAEANVTEILDAEIVEDAPAAMDGGYE
jgi:hypothetical protein